MTADNADVSSIVRMLVADVMGMPDQLGDARVNERHSWALSPLACKQVDFGIAETPESSVVTSLIRTLERREQTRAGEVGSSSSSSKLPASLQCQTLIRQLQSSSPALKERPVILRFLALMAGSDDKENYSGNVDALARVTTKPVPSSAGVASDMLKMTMSAPSDQPKTIAQTKGVTEKELVRDLVFVLQGIDGSIFRFNSRTERYIFGGISNGRDIELPARHASACLDLCRVGGTYRRLLERVNRLLDDDSLEAPTCPSRTAGAFANQIRDRLMEYYRLTVTLESRVAGSGWTLQHLQAWAYQPGRQLAALERLTQACLSEKNGGAMISDIITLRDSRADFATRWLPAQGSAPACTLRSVLDEIIISRTLQPLVAMIHLWVSEGRLMKGGEADFFIEEHAAVSNRTTSCSDIWTGAFVLDFDKVPSIITEDVALKIFVTGKSINFVRQCCSEGDWLGDQDEPLPHTEGGEETSAESLTRMVQAAYRRETSLVFRLMMNKYRLQEHLLAVKKYLLLSQGDFVGHLLDLMTEHLSTRAQGLHFPPGWEIFSLDYIATQPISVILNDGAMHQYRRVFSISWRLHRAERQLSSAWSQQMIAHRTVLRAVHQKRQKGSSASPNDSAIHLLQTCNALRHEMWHLVQHLRSFFAFNVIDTAWQKLRDALDSLASQQEADLDRVLRLHEEYLSRLAAGHFLNHSADTAAGKKQMKVFDVLNELLSGIYQFTTLQERIYGDLSGAALGCEGREDEMPLMDEATAVEFKRAVTERREEFLGNLQKFCAGAMAMKTELKHLVNRIDFNCFYY
ncbi:Gamma-tubulin complex component 3 [Perkinsus olseni]|uniref:Gamma-tubulin complex component 3 n=1 Tax=Perkinsus olseni TaxID=32597 RepID=A0A7J6M424_PEROL|nr:Gamma-tubulin complex component 3 [Perkinsus olseni]